MDKDNTLSSQKLVIAETQTARIEPHPSIISFHGEKEVLLEFMRNGDIFVKGELVENNQQVVEGFKEFLRERGYYHGE